MILCDSRPKLLPAGIKQVVLLPSMILCSLFWLTTCWSLWDQRFESFCRIVTALEAARLADTFETNCSLSEQSRLSFQQPGMSKDHQPWRMKCQPEGERLRQPTKSPGESRFSTCAPPGERQTPHHGATRQQYPEGHQPEQHQLQRQGVKGKPVVCYMCNQAAMGKSSLEHLVKYKLKNDYLICPETGKEIEGQQLSDRLMLVSLGLGKYYCKMGTRSCSL
nr:uncharacterized protein LOC128691808 [Cherax quadricarinatus]